MELCDKLTNFEKKYYVIPVTAFSIEVRCEQPNLSAARNHHRCKKKDDGRPLTVSKEARRLQDG